MAKSYGVGAIFTWRNQGLQGVGKANRAVSKLREDLTRLGTVGTAMTTGWAAGFAHASKFEEQMATVGAVTRASRLDLMKMREAALEFSLDSKFKPIEVAQALEELGRADFNSAQALQALPGVMSLAAAEGIGLSQATTVIADNLRAFGLEESFAAEMADKLSFAATRSTATISDMQHALKFAAPSLKLAGKGLEEGLAALMMLHNVGIKGTLAGTALKNMVLRTGTLTKGQIAALGGEDEVKRIFEDGSGNLLRLDQIAMNVMRKAQEKFTTKREQSAFLTKLFGLRGLPSIPALLNGVHGEGYDRLYDEILNAQGFATESAHKRLDSFYGDLGRLRAKLSALLIAMAKPFEGPARSFAAALSGVAESAFHALNVLSPLRTETQTYSRELNGLAATFKGYYDVLAGALTTVAGAVQGVMKWFNSLSEARGRQIGRFFGFLSVGGPLILGISLLMKGVSFLAAPFVHFFGLISAVGLPAILGITAALMVFYGAIENRRALTGEDFGTAAAGTALGIFEDLTRVVGKIWDAFSSFGPEMIEGFVSVVKDLAASVSLLGMIFAQNQDALSGPADISGWKALGKALGAVTYFFSQMVEFVHQLINLVVGYPAGLIAKKSFDVSNREYAQELNADFQERFSDMIFDGERGNDFDVAAAIDRFRNFSYIRQRRGEDLPPEARIALHRFLSKARYSEDPAIQERFAHLTGLQQRENISPMNMVTPEDIETVAAGGALNLAAVLDAAINRLEGERLDRSIGYSAPAPVVRADLTVPVSIQVDGREIARTVASRQIEIGDRSGQSFDPAQRTAAAEHGALPALFTPAGLNFTPGTQ